LRPAPDLTVAANSARWADARLAAQLFAIDPAGLVGITVVAEAGPVRDHWFGDLRGALAAGIPVRRLPARIEDDRLLGGVDLVATLRTGTPILQTGLLAETDGGVVVIPMAERLSGGNGARIAGALDRGEVVIERDGLSRRLPTRIGVVAFDEAASPEEQVPSVLSSRLAFLVDLRDLSLRATAHEAVEPAATEAARKRLGSVEPATDEIIAALVATAMRLGIDSVVPPLLSLRVARAAAALAGRHRIETDDAVLAARLVLAPRARVAPVPEETKDQRSEDPPLDDAAPQPAMPEQSDSIDAEAPAAPSAMSDLADVMLAAVEAALPEHLLASLQPGSQDRRPAGTAGSIGALQAAALRGRPIGSRPGALHTGARLALVDTLRAAAPWQRLRAAELPERPGARRIAVRASDIRLKRFAERRDSTIVFCVDASGSAAFHRLAEAKGAVELLLAEAYVARTQAALIAFRGQGAELILPPTRSLSRAKALLASLPGGGGTPLASGIDLAVLVALAERRKGREPLVVLLTDGRANIGRDGAPARAGAADEALASARQAAAKRVSAVFIDTSPRPRDDAAALASAMGARYVALPYVEAAAVRDAVRDAAPTARPRSPAAR
jgi:magnesium chelatase subunit D